MLWSVCAFRCLSQRAREFILNQSNALSTPKSRVAMESWAAAMHVLQMGWTSNCHGAPGKTWSSQETTRAKHEWNGTRHCIGCEAGEWKITPLTLFFKHAGVNLSPPRWLSRSSPPRSPKPRGNSHAKKAMRDADLFGTSDKFSCPEESCGILQKSKFCAYYNTLVWKIILFP